MYPCEAEHSSELSFEIGAIFEDGKYCLELCGEDIISPLISAYRVPATGCSPVWTAACLDASSGCRAAAQELCVGGSSVSSSFLAVAIPAYPWVFLWVISDAHPSDVHPWRSLTSATPHQALQCSMLSAAHLQNSERADFPLWPHPCALQFSANWNSVRIFIEFAF